MLKNILTFLLMLTGFSGWAQDWFSQHSQGESVSGYIITIAGDTLSGSINYDYPVIMQKRISFTPAGNQNPVIYQPKDIRGYGCGENFWESSTVVFQTYQGPVNFSRFGILYYGKGPLHLLRIFPEMDKFKKQMSSTRAETIYNKITLRQDQKSFNDLYLKKFEDPAESVNSSAFKKDFITSVSRKISDDSELMNKIKNKEYKYTDLPKIIDEYNQWYLQKKYK